MGIHNSKFDKIDDLRKDVYNLAYSNGLFKNEFSVDKRSEITNNIKTVKAYIYTLTALLDNGYCTNTKYDSFCINIIENYNNLLFKCTLNMDFPKKYLQKDIATGLKKSQDIILLIIDNLIALLNHLDGELYLNPYKFDSDYFNFVKLPISL